MRTKRRGVNFAAAILAGVMLVGCKTGQYARIGSQSHFDYPNSNVTPLGTVKVTMIGSTIFSPFGGPPDTVTSESDLKVYNAALAQVPGASLIADYGVLYKTYEFWPVQWSKLELEGTACKMVVGKKDINH